MKELNYKELIKESAEELLFIEKQQERINCLNYVRFLRYLKEGSAETQAMSSHLIGLNKRHGQRIWQTYKKGGLDLLLAHNQKGQIGRLSYVQISWLHSFLRTSETGLTQEQIAIWIEKSFGVSYTQSGISKLFSRLKIKLKTGRPVSIRQKEGDVELFKKSLVSE